MPRDRGGVIRRAVRLAWLPCLLASFVLSGCPSPARVRQQPRPEPPPPVLEEPEPEPEPVEEEEPAFVVPEDATAPEGGAACTTGRECSAAQLCRGPRGCGLPWACGEACAPGAETIAYCDCDGQTFYAPMGCPGRAYVHPGACDMMGPLAAADELGMHAYDEPPTDEDRTCTSSAECPAGEQCYGPPGCGMSWRCERVRGCGATRVELCGCDGQSFRASPHCPGRPYLRRGSCDGVAVAALSPNASGTASERRPPSVASGSVAPTSSPSTAPGVSGAEGTCTSQRDCRGGTICTGPEGCGMTWTCQRPARRCNPDTQVFCDCERNTFRASMTCPGRPYAHRGSCEIDRMLELSGAALR